MRFPRKKVKMENMVKGGQPWGPPTLWSEKGQILRKRTADMANEVSGK